MTPRAGTGLTWLTIPTSLGKSSGTQWSFSNFICVSLMGKISGAVGDPIILAFDINLYLPIFPVRLVVLGRVIDQVIVFRGLHRLLERGRGVSGAVRNPPCCAGHFLKGAENAIGLLK